MNLDEEDSEQRLSSVHERLLSKEEIIEEKVRLLSQDFLYVGIRKSDSSVDVLEAKKLAHQLNYFALISQTM